MNTRPPRSWVTCSGRVVKRVDHSNVTFTVMVLGVATTLLSMAKGRGAPTVDDGRISGAATATLVVSSLVVQDAGSYVVVVSNSLGVVTSATATLRRWGFRPFPPRR